MENYRDNFKESIENFNKVNTLSYKTKTVTPKETVRKWYLVDAENQTLGRISSEIAKILQGKNKPSYTPNIDTGDHVIIINAEKVALSGAKREQKMDYRHSGFPGGLSATSYGDLLEANHGQRFWRLVNQFPRRERARGYLMAVGLEQVEEDA